jgi:hypothetical protein
VGEDGKDDCTEFMEDDKEEDVNFYDLNYLKI